MPFTFLLKYSKEVLINKVQITEVSVRASVICL